MISMFQKGGFCIIVHGENIAYISWLSPTEDKTKTTHPREWPPSCQHSCGGKQFKIVYENLPWFSFSFLMFSNIELISTHKLIKTI